MHILTAVLSGAISLQGMARPVSIRIPAQPLESLVPYLGMATKQRLVVSPELAREIACIDVHGVSAEDLLVRLATVCGGRWEKVGNIQVLSQDKAGQAALERRAFRRRVEVIKAELDPAVNRPMKTNLDGGIILRPPEDPIIPQLLTALGPAKLASIGWRDRVVLSSAPTSLQFQFPELSTELEPFILRANDHIREEAEKNERFANELRAQKGQPKTEGSPETIVRTGSNLSAASLIGPGFKADLVLFRPLNMQDADIQASLVLFDRNGNRVPIGAIGYVEEAGMRIARDRLSKQAPEPFLKLRIEASDLARYYLATNQPFRAFMHSAGDISTALSERVSARLLEPDKDDPLLYSGEVVEALAEQRGEQLVACLPDTFISFFPSAINARPSRVHEGLLSNPEILAEEANGWLTVSPANFASQPINRQELNALAAKLHSLTALKLDDLVSLADRGLGDLRNQAVCQETLLLPPTISKAASEINWQMLRMYATLTPAQLNRCGEDGQLPLSALTDSQLALANQLIYGNDLESPVPRDGFLTVRRFTKLAVGGHARRPIEMDEEAPFGMDYQNEPTEVAPDGLLSVGFITVTNSEDEGLCPVYEDAAGLHDGEFFRGGLQSAFFRLAMEIQGGLGAPPHKFKMVRFGKERQVKFRIYVGKNSFRSTSFSELKLRPTVASLDLLPANAKAAYDQAMDMAAKMIALRPNPLAMSDQPDPGSRSNIRKQGQP